MRLLASAGLAAWPFGDLEPFSYGLIMVDAPWDFSLHSIKGGNKSAQKHYRCLPIEEIKAFPIQDLASDDCMLMLWATAPMLDQQMDVLKHWGFTFKTEMVWRKVTKTGKQCFGAGYITRGSHESILIGTKGAPRLVHKKNIRSCFDGVRRRHSEKPIEAYVIAERMMPKVRKIEIFSRSSRPGWDSFGDQVGAFDNGGAPELLDLSAENFQAELAF